ncbi:site-specific integrase [Maribacter litopenaei]|uniref:Site-specific integrase n=1 Tax=Maribacter litopenaei TaxID=2976127 RepID=A0ABY5YAJ8_9FLAO|nr:site-specific integrase [Maribacter litopenaei]UWX55734.1 site-specific integrase [Maribacter litopenaei]
MQLTFHLRKDKANKAGQMPVRMVLTFNGERIRVNMKGIRVLQKDWKEREQRVKANGKREPYNYHIEYNMQLDELDTKVKKLFRYMMLNAIHPSKDYVTNKLSFDSEINLSHEFFPSFHEFIQKGKNVKTDGTLRRYGTALNFYKDFSEFTGYELTFDEINLDFFEKFRDYAFEEKQTLNNYFSKLISVLKTFMSWSHERGYHDNLLYKKFKAPEQEIEVVYLTMDELMRLYQHEFHNRRLEHTRDTYCFGCFTGLRYSDLSQLRVSHIHEDYLLMNIKKTKTIAHKIPLNRFAKEIRINTKTPFMSLYLLFRMSDSIYI